MKKQAFSSEQYLNLQRDHILERINQFDGKLYLEFGGKMLEDFHAARVLPGYEPDNKIKLLQELKEQVEVVIAINAIISSIPKHVVTWAFLMTKKFFV